MSVMLYIERMKFAFGVKTDEDLAGRLGLSKQAVSNWRKRGAVPLKVQQTMRDHHGISYAEWNLEFGEPQAEIVYAVSLYIFESITKPLPKPLTVANWRTYGQAFPLILRAVGRHLEGISTGAGSSEAMISMLQAYYDSGRFTGVSKLVEAIGTDE